MEKTITAIVPVKGNSSRLPNKNILPFGDSNLLLHKIEQLKKVKGITNIIVSSDSNRMLQMAEDAGVQAWKRPQKYADESVPFGRFLDYLCEVLPNEHILWACVTSPLVESELYEKAIQLYFEKLKEGFDSLITCLPCQSYYMDEKGPINTTKARPIERVAPGVITRKSVDVPLQTGIKAPKSKIAEWHYNYGPNAYRLMVNKRQAVDIDDIYDYECAKAMLNMENK